MPYWIQSTLAATPALAWMFLGLGLPWALVILPRRDWRDWPTVACLTLAFGPALLTAWMFILGEIGGLHLEGVTSPYPLLYISPVIFGTVIIAIPGWGALWAKLDDPERKTQSLFQPTNYISLKMDEKLLLILIGIALVVRWIGVAYWPSTAYDALWVYAYEGKLYTMLGYIPSTISYYPQFLPLQHTYLQLAVGGLDDHAARAILPWLHLGSIFAAYILGKHLFNRRVGIYVAAIWALYPHVGEWSRYGDLEIPVAFLFTAAAAFFILAWKNARQEFPVLSPENSAAALALIASMGINIDPDSQETSAEAATPIPAPTFVSRYAIIAGLLLGVGMWTKPTMGAFIWGVLLLVVIEYIYRFIQASKLQLGLPTSIVLTINTAWPRVQVAVWTGFASIPLGAAWYLRNLLNGHRPIDLPPGYWQTLAAQSGVEFGWPLLALLLLLGWLVFSYQRSIVSNQPEKANTNALPIPNLLIGLALVLVGLLPSIINTGQVGITDNRMGIIEWLALAAGSILLFVSLWRWVQNRWTDEGCHTVSTIAWALALALPYFVTWFFSYSYHYRLSFAIVPVLILPTAVILAKWTENFSPQKHRLHREDSDLKGISSPFSGLGFFGSRMALASGGAARKTFFLLAIIALSIPGIIAPLYDVNAGWDWLWTDKLPDDHARYESGNVALMSVVDGLQTYVDSHDEPLRVVAPGMDRLPFFFPTADIRLDMPTSLDDLDGYTYFIYGTPETGGDFPTFTPGSNPVLDVLSLATDDIDDTKSVLRRAWWKDDGIFKYTVYELHLEKRWQQPEVTIPPQVDVVFGGFLRYLGYDIQDHGWWQGRKLTTNFFWQVLEPPPADYVIYIHLLDPQGELWMAWDAPITRTEDGRYYSSLVWQPGEYIIDRRSLQMTNLETPLGDDYRVVIGLYDRITQQRVPVTIDGQPDGDGFTLEKSFSMLPGSE